ncbi:acetamidase [Paracoccidioides lutzii Pb01]|uniref:amidase n=1 Tax=Paracoccidioides lutzii (strain ATCC MYA-826 / Pb01) TaxID=502779 RepID=C1H7B7_PARBA|nr:acetamidase [Paracoccidioides lutzii Pb01]EEH35611.2 acetamidase [Paracoccidioides lutzii Pb01]
MLSEHTWEAIAAAKREELLSSIPSEWIIQQEISPPESQADVTSFPEKSGWFTADELEITSSTASEILQKTATGVWSAEAVTHAFCKRAAAAHQLTNCLLETLFPAALESAKALDAHFAATGKPVGPLHGVPISLKDNFDIIGKDSTIGFTGWVNDPATYNSIMTDLLREAEAVLYVKTNVPTATMIAETVNNVFGHTLNPRHRLFTSGGSSGGESALIAFGGSPLGVGTDIGGSLRIPAACTGIFTLRPSFGRFPNFLTKSGLAGQESVLSVNGPMATTLECINSSHPPLLTVSPGSGIQNAFQSLGTVEPKQRLKLAVLWDDGLVRPTPRVLTALKETVEKLRSAGHEVVDCSNLPTFARTASFSQTAERPCKESLRPPKSPFDLRWTCTAKSKTAAFRHCGSSTSSATSSSRSTWSDGMQSRHVGYTGVYNILDYSCLSFPCGVHVDATVDVPAVDEVELSIIDGEVQKEYNPAVVHGQPVSLQLVGRRLEEEKVAMMGEVISKALQEKSPGGDTFPKCNGK